MSLFRPVCAFEVEKKPKPRQWAAVPGTAADIFFVFRLHTKDQRNSARPQIGIYQAGLPGREIGNPDRDLRRKRKETARKWAAKPHQNNFKNICTENFIKELWCEDGSGLRGTNANRTRHQESRAIFFVFYSTCLMHYADRIPILILFIGKMSMKRPGMDPDLRGPTRKSGTGSTYLPTQNSELP
jgi:hypothetical protein